MGVWLGTNRVGVVLAVAGPIGVVVGAALPWFETGPARRSAFTLIRVANELDVFEVRLHRLGVSALLATPVLAGLVVLALGLRWTRVAGLVALVAAAFGLVAGGFGITISGAIIIGPIVTLAAAVMAAVGGVLLVMTRIRTGVALGNK
jgi:hypothetical protein